MGGDGENEQNISSQQTTTEAKCVRQNEVVVICRRAQCGTNVMTAGYFFNFRPLNNASIAVVGVATNIPLVGTQYACILR